MRLLDAHIHIDFYDDIEKILHDIIACDIHAVFVTHLPELYEKYRVQISKYPNICLALGYHPVLIREYDLNRPLFQRMLSHCQFVGEIGLDYSITSSQTMRAKQRDSFEFICRNVDEHILSIHSRLADEDVLKILKNTGVKKAIFHWYTGSDKLIPKIIENGYYFSVNQAMLRSTKGTSILKKLPQDRLLIETDGPFTKHGGHITIPKDLASIYRDFSEFYKVKDISAMIWQNYVALLR